MERFSYASASSSQANTSCTAAANNPQEDPFSIELNRLDVLDLTENNALMKEVIDFKKSLLEDAKLMRKVLGLDQISVKNEENSTPKRIKKKPPAELIKSQRRYNVDDDDVVLPNEDAPADQDDPKIDEHNKIDEDASDEEEIPMSDDEEDNDYMDAHFDNGEDYID